MAEEQRPDWRSAVDIELYKSLKAESSVYIEKVPALWLQKFVLIGGLIAFLLTQDERFDVVGKGDAADTAFDVALLSIPVLACLLDAKIMEYGLHARVISRFIEVEFPSHRSQRWERTLWGYSHKPFERRLVMLRSATTVLVTVAPTALIVMLDAALLYVRREQGWILVAGALVSIAYVGFAGVTVRMVWPSTADVESRRSP
jgi:hypothetical protein